MAPVHLLDENTGEYNVSYIKECLAIKWPSCRRRKSAGLMLRKVILWAFVKLKISKKYRYVNRQKRSRYQNTFDFKLKEAKIDPAEINGYSNEMTTHMAVAALVKSESADVGLGIQSAAKAMGLGF